MFYVKHDLEFTTVETVIHADNVYTECPGCGAEQQINLAEIPAFDPEATAVYCPTCTRLRRRGQQRP